MNPNLRQTFLLSVPVAQRTPITNRAQAVVRLTGYASEWFAATHTKPHLTVIPGTRVISQNIRTHVLAHLLEGNANHIAITAFIAQEFFAIGALLMQRWESFAQVIGEAGAQLSIYNLVELTENEVAPDLEAGQLMAANEVHRFLMIIFAVHRFIPIQNQQYAGQLENHFNRLMASYGYPATPMTNLVENYRSWGQYPHFKTLMAACDMFLHRFPDHRYAACRFGSIISRNRDASLFSSVHFLHNLLGMDYVDLGDWIWIDSVANQYASVLKENEERHLEYSFVFYLMDFHLSLRSPYSAGACPDLHFFIHIIGCCFQDQRSINARIVGTPTIGAVFNNAVVVAHACFVSQKMGKQFGGANEIRQDDDDDMGDPNLQEGVIPIGRNPDQWLGYMNQRRGEVPMPILNRLAGVWRTFNRSREQTVGRFLFEFAQGLRP